MYFESPVLKHEVLIWKTLKKAAAAIASDKPAAQSVDLVLNLIARRL